MTMPGYGAGRPSPNKGRTYPPDPPPVEEIVALLRGCPDTPFGRRLRALIVVLWRSGLRISEAVALLENDLNPTRGSITVRSGKGGKRRVVGMDPWGWQLLEPWLRERQAYPIGAVFCVLDGPTAGRPVRPAQIRYELRRLRERTGIRRRIAPHQFRHGMAVDWVRERQPIHLLQRQLGHTNLAITTTYLMAVSVDEVLEVSHQRRPPLMPITGLVAESL
jgi:integrase